MWTRASDLWCWTSHADPLLARPQDFAAQNYGELPLNQSQERHGRTYASLEDVKAENDGKDIFFSARIQTSRTPSAKFVFLTLRHAFFCVQAVLAQAPEKVSKQM